MADPSGTQGANRVPGEFRGARGIDEPTRQRPGVPMEAEPQPDAGASWQTPERQQSDAEHLHRAGLDELTPVYGTAQPPRGLSGIMRRTAYKLPEHTTRHWAILLAADRVDVWEDRLRHGMPPSALDATVRRVRTNPLPAILVGVLAGVVIQRALRSR